MQKQNISNLNELSKLMTKQNTEISDYIQIVKRSIEQQKENNPLFSNEEIFGKEVTQKDIRDNEKLKELLENYEKELKNQYENVEKMRVEANQQIFKEFTEDLEIDNNKNKKESIANEKNNDNNIEESIDLSFLNQNNNKSIDNNHINELNIDSDKDNEFNIDNISELKEDMTSSLSKSSKFEQDIDNTTSFLKKGHIVDHIAEIMGKDHNMDNDNNIKNDEIYGLNR